MKYFTRIFSTPEPGDRNDVEREAWHELCDQHVAALSSLYLSDLSELLTHLDPSVSEFSRINTCFHDEKLQSVECCDNELRLITRLGKVIVYDVDSINIEGNVNSAWITEEIVSPDDRELLVQGFFQFNVLLDCGEVSCLGKRVRFVKRRNQR